MYVLQELFYRTTGKHLAQELYGKPQKASFSYAEMLIDEQSDAMNGPKVDTIFMIGDNPETDIKGANEAGGRWKSVLTRSGVYQDSHVSAASHGADFVVDCVVEALAVIQRAHSPQ